MKASLRAVIDRPERNPELRGYTGRIFEREVLGECRTRAEGYVRFRPALNAVFRNQPQSPFEPAGHAAVLFDAVAGQMKSRGLNPNRLQLYTAVGSALDRFHGIDGFFYFEGIIVTLDATINPHKDVSRARVLITGEDFLVDFEESSSMIAWYFDKSLKCGWKGVV